MDETFISCEAVIAACHTDDEPRHYFDHDRARAIVGRMTGLNMSRYDLVVALDAYGWHLVRRPDA